MKNVLVVTTTILVAMFWGYKVFAADYGYPPHALTPYSYYLAQPERPVVYYEPAPTPPVVAVPDEDEDSNLGTGCRPGCKCEYDALGKPEIDCKEE